MIKADLSSGAYVTISLYREEPYHLPSVKEAVRVLLEAGALPRRASFWKTAPSETRARALYDGEPEIIERKLNGLALSSELERLVLGRCYLDLPTFPLPCQIMLRSRFHADETFSLNVEFPATALFEEDRLGETGRQLAWMGIESLAIALFESSSYLFGGIYWEEDAPSREELRSGERTLPENFGLYSENVVTDFGPARLESFVNSAVRYQRLASGGVYFAWSDWVLDARQRNVPDEFIELISGFSRL